MNLDHSSKITHRNYTLPHHSSNVVPNAAPRQLILNFADICHKPLKRDLVYVVLYVAVVIKVY
jgi:hypothetical protein